MKLSNLLAAAPLGRDGPPTGADPTITNLTDDSRKVGPGSVFVAVPGVRSDGHAFVAAACSAGAAALVLERPMDVPAGVPALLAADSAAWLARAAMAWHGVDRIQRAGGLPAVGITGTNGKSTTAFLVQAMLNAAGRPTAVIGTVTYDLVGRRIPAPMTTPPALDLAAALAEAHGHGARALAMEVSSHALAQKRPDGIRFQAGVFTNLTGDHLDYHGTMEAYRAAKKRLFEGLDRDAWAIFNGEDPSTDELARGCKGRVVRFGLAKGARIDLPAEIVQMTAGGSVLDIRWMDERCRISTSLLGRHNVQNLLGAIGAGLALGLDLESAARGAASLANVRGRLERVDARGLGFEVLVDYAHTDDALRNVLAALRPVTRGELWCVFGCGGDRDRTKRPRMARVAEELADRIVVTSDNPRSERPEVIIGEISDGFSASALSRCAFEPDRAAAIALAVSRARPGDTVLIAGKGHEDYQIVGSQRLPFNDVEVAAEAIGRRSGERSHERAA